MYQHNLFILCILRFFFIQPCESHICVISLQSDYHFEYTECDVLGSRWRVAIPNKASTCTGLPDPVKGTQCSEFPTFTTYVINIFKSFDLHYTFRCK